MEGGRTVLDVAVVMRVYGYVHTVVTLACGTQLWCEKDVAKHAVNASTCEQYVKVVLQDTCSQTEGDHGCEGTRNACELSSLCMCGMRAGENKNE